LLHNAKDWPTDEELRNGILGNDFYLSGKTHQRLFVLSELDRSYHPATVLNYVESDDSIEHILPQAERPLAWEADLRGIDEELAAVRERYGHTLGNLTLVTPEMNSALGHKRFAEKCAIYVTSDYAPTRNLAADFDGETRAQTVWGSAAIVARANELHARAAELWPRPAAPITVEEEPEAAEIDLEPDEEAIPFTSSIEEEAEGAPVDDESA
jgi:hypothetical protein